MDEEEGESGPEDESKDESMDTADIPQMAIKPVEVHQPPVTKPLELSIPSQANEIPAQ
jgi:hypothetical protein